MDGCMAAFSCSSETFGHGISDRQAIYNKFDIEDEQRKNDTKGFIGSRCIVSALLVVLALMLAAVFSFTFVKCSSQMRKVESDILQLKTEVCKASGMYQNIDIKKVTSKKSC
ncbi:UNVERIFIED_CONTAM: hypothetical protein FKN15_016214 [Acipenser sinensis]